jgi:diguanylate cyclase (GGDEF)-like protein/PAS domain S-box-containing protein
LPLDSKAKMLPRPNAAASTTRTVTLLSRYGDGLVRRLDRGQAELALGHGKALQRADTLMRNIVQQSFDGILSFGEDGRVVTANAAAQRIFHCRHDDLIGRHIARLFPDLENHRRLGGDDWEGGGGRLEGIARRLDGTRFPVELALRPTVVDDERLVITIVRDITWTKKQQAKLRHQALHDALTGLPNRILLRDRLNQALRAAAREQEPLALLLLDLDRFKEVNDTLGHQVGDTLLVNVAGRIQACIRQSDTIVRLGGDEFALLLPPPSDLERALFVSERIVEAIREPFDLLDGLRIEVGVSIGIAIFPEHAGRASRLLQCADIAMYAAKRGTARIQPYDPAKDDNNVRYLTLSGALRQAIEGGELSLEYQPKLDLGRGEIRSVEALARWRHPTQGAISPEEFVPQAERTGMIQPFTRWSFDAAFAQLADWRERGLDINLAVNLSARSLHDEALPETVAALLDHWRVDPQRITLELTESAVMLDPSHAQKSLHRLHDLGLRLSIDDFGTGYSSLSHLQRLPLHELKIDSRSWST